LIDGAFKTKWSRLAAEQQSTPVPLTYEIKSLAVVNLMFHLSEHFFVRESSKNESRCSATAAGRAGSAPISAEAGYRSPGTKIQ